MKIHLKEYTQRAGISMASAYRYVNQGRVESIKKGNTTYVILSDPQAENFSVIKKNSDF